MIKKTLLLSLCAIFINFSFAAEKATEKKLGETVLVNVKGLVCDFCAVGLKKTFGKKTPEVNSIDVSLKEQKIILYFEKDKTLADEKITKLIKDNGYNIVSIVRNYKAEKSVE